MNYDIKKPKNLNFTENIFIWPLNFVSSNNW
jgi:hypothetical protein